MSFQIPDDIGDSFLPPRMYTTVLNTLANALQCDIIANSDTVTPLAQCIARPPAAVVNCDLNAANGFFSARKTSAETAMPAIPTIPNCSAQTLSLSSSAKFHPPDDPPLTDTGNERLFTETLNSLRELAKASPDYTLANDYCINVESTATANADCHLYGSAALMTSASSAAMDDIQLPDPPPKSDGVCGATAPQTPSARYCPDVEPISEVEDGDDDITLPDKPSSSPQNILTCDEFQAALRAHYDFAAFLSRELRAKSNLINKRLENIEKQADKLDECMVSLQSFYASHIASAFAGDGAAQRVLHSASDNITAKISKRKLAIPKPRRRKYTKTTDKKLWIHPPPVIQVNTRIYMYICIFYAHVWRNPHRLSSGTPEMAYERTYM